MEFVFIFLILFKKIYKFLMEFQNDDEGEYSYAGSKEEYYNEEDEY
jgi:hypothetical protein